VNPAASIRAALARRSARWESLCRRCGLCCYEKERQGRSVVTDFRRPCRYLDISTRRCTVYDHRFDACPQCGRMTVLHALFVKWLPPQCGYVQRFRPRRAAARPGDARPGAAGRGLARRRPA